MRNERGLTLIEVLVALAVLSGVVGSVLVLIGQHARQAAALEERMLARVVAENVMSLHLANLGEGQPTVRRGEEALGGREFTFTVDSDGAPLEGYTLLTVHVRLGRDGQELAALSTLRSGAGE